MEEDAHTNNNNKVYGTMLQHCQQMINHSFEPHCPYALPS
jgi:hypothetical protein